MWASGITWEAKRGVSTCRNPFSMKKPLTASVISDLFLNMENFSPLVILYYTKFSNPML